MKIRNYSYCALQLLGIAKQHTRHHTGSNGSFYILGLAFEQALFFIGTPAWFHPH